MRRLQEAARPLLVLTIAVALGISFGAPVRGVSTKGIAGLSTMQTISLQSLTTEAVASSDPPPVAIRAVNPGYTIDGIKNTGEMIELINLTSVSQYFLNLENSSDDIHLEDGVFYKEPQVIALDDVAIVYTAKPSSLDTPGKSTILYEFPPGSQFVGRSILLRFGSAPEVADSNQDLTYDTSLAMSGTLSLMRLSSDVDSSSFPTASPLSDFGEVFNSVCWLGGEECLPIFSTTVKSRSYTTILRNDFTGEYSHVNDPELLYDPTDPGLYLPPIEDVANVLPSDFSDDVSANIADSAKQNSGCTGIEFSEIFSYYDADPSEQFIEFFNSSDNVADLSACQVRYKNKLYNLSELSAMLAPSEYYVLHPEFRLTKNPNTENLLELVDVDGAIVDSISYPHGQKKSASYALVGYNTDGLENWQVTYAPTPGAGNVYQEYRSCPEGKIINESTGNCVKASTLAATALKDCGAGKYRNPLTGRCKSYDNEDEKEPCKEGYERNPETGRCRKVKENNGADYPIVPLTNYEEKSTFIALWALIGIGVIGLFYIVFQFRREIIYFFRKLFTKLKKS